MAYTIEEVLANAEEELMMRHRVYPSRIGAGKMKATDASRKIAIQQQTVKILEWLKANQDDIKAVMGQVKMRQEERAKQAKQESML